MYYYNSETKESTWSKPDDLKTKAELMLDKCPWKEHKNVEGKAYYYNAETKESVWSVPAEFEEMKSESLMSCTKECMQTL